MTAEKCKEKKTEKNKTKNIRRTVSTSQLTLAYHCLNYVQVQRRIFKEILHFYYLTQLTVIKKIIAGQTNSNMKLPKCWYTDDWVDFPCLSVGDLKQVRFNPLVKATCGSLQVLCIELNRRCKKSIRQNFIYY